MDTTRTAAGAIALVLVAAGCTSAPATDTTTPPTGAPAADDAARQLATALTKGDVSTLAMTTPATLAQAELKTLTGAMDGLRPTVAPGRITYDAAQGTATAPLEQTLPLGTGTWRWQTRATWKYQDGAWKLQWKPTIVQSDLDGTTRLRHSREVPTRAPINGADDLALVEVRTAYRLGIDKANLPPTTWATSATALATLVKVDAAAYAKQVAASGPLAFVTAITVRQNQIPAGLAGIPGARSVPVERPLAPSSSFALGLLGSAGEATPEVVKASRGDILPGDIVGVSGLQKRYDAQLRGTVGHTISIVARAAGTTTGAASPSPISPSPAATASSPGGHPGSATPAARVLFTQPAKPGTPVVTSLDQTLQAKAERILASTPGVASIVVLQTGTGDLLAAANSPASGANPDATAGHYAPGSTFKVVTALALLRKGLTPTSLVPCTPTVTVNGRSFKNYTDFPTSKLGNITLTDALANSCNTAFISQHALLTGTDLADAAESLGMGKDHLVGFNSWFGSVPTTTDPVTAAADMIGQGTVEASPLIMATVANSVASGRTVLPRLVAGQTATPTGKPLSATEAKQLQAMMAAVVTQGSGRILSGLATGAKTGTAEFGTARPPRTHAWMIAWNKDHAIAAMVNEGTSGSGTAGPLVKALLAAG